MKSPGAHDHLTAPAAAAELNSGKINDFFTLIDALPVAAYSCDAAGLITHFNNAAVQLWGKTPKLNNPEDRFCGSFRLFSIDGVPIQHDACWMALALQTKQGFNRKEIIIERPDGERRQALAHANPIHDRHGVVIGAVNILIDVTEQKQEMLRARRFSRIFEDSLNEIYIFDAKTYQFVQVNLSAQTNLGYSMEELHHLTPVDIKPEFTVEQFNALVAPLRNGSKSIVVFDTVHQRKNGTLYNVEVHLQLLEDNGHSSFMAIIIDTSDRIASKKRVERFARIFEDSLNEIYIFDAKTYKFVQVNLSAQKNLGYTMEELHHLTPLDIKPDFTMEHFNELVEPLRNDNKSLVVFDTMHRRKDGSLYNVEVHLQLLEDNGHSSFVAIILDITERKQAHRLLAYQASHDALTGLMNRREFEVQVKDRLESTATQDIPHILLFVDLDQFKVINDTCGHAAGDELLRRVTRLFEGCLREGDIVARLGGDEFGVFLHNCSFDDGLILANGLKQSIHEFDFHWHELTFRIGVCIGLVPIDATLRNLSELMKNADTACYLAKESGRNRIHVFRATDAEVIRRKNEMGWVSRLHKALDENRFHLHAQVMVSAHGGKPGYELLTRMIDVDGSMVPPGDFLPAAERYNIISKLDRWVVAHAVNFIAGHADRIDDIGFFSINLSGQSVTNLDLLCEIVGLLMDSGIEGSKLCFEITETAAITHLDKATKFIRTLKEYGCRIALDDFGSGFSSFAHLKNLNIDFLKIDGQFIQNVCTDSVNSAMVRSVCELARVMNIKTIAEHIENEEIRNHLSESGIDYFQGYHIGTPVPITRIFDRSGHG